MDLLNEIRFFQNTGFFPCDAMNEAAMWMEAMDESSDGEVSPERDEILRRIEADDFVVDDYDAFVNNLRQSKRSSFLTQYTPDDFKNNGVKTFQVRDYPIGYALKKDADGVDIISVHNNSGVGGIGDALIQSAVKHGGTKLDHFHGYLSDFYTRNGFEEYDRYKWDDQYAPKDWDYDKYGRPDVIFRRLKNR